VKQNRREWTQPGHGKKKENEKKTKEENSPVKMLPTDRVRPVSVFETKSGRLKAMTCRKAATTSENGSGKMKTKQKNPSAVRVRSTLRVE